MAKIASILIVDPVPATQARYLELLEKGEHEVVVADTLTQASAHLGATCVDLVLAADCLGAGELALLSQSALQRGATLVLGCGSTPTIDSYRLAMELGCHDLLPLDGTPAAAAATLARARVRRDEAAQVREEIRRLEFQSEELRQRCAQQAVRFSESQETFFLDLSRMMTIITNIMDGIVFVDRAGNVTLLNPVAEDLLGVKSFVALGKPIAAMQGRTELVGALGADHGRLESHKEVTQTVEVHHSEQDLLYIKCITSRVLDYRGQPAGALSVLKDVTAEFKTDQLKNQYLSIVAHELRTPLTGIKTFSTMMVKGALGALSEPQQRVCESIREQSVRLEHQIDKLINLGNLESADYGQDREVFSVAEFTNGLLAPFEQPARDRRIDLQLHVAETDLGIYGDRSDLRRACQALVENAIKFAPDEGHVAVRIEVTDSGELVFGVKDDGIGIDPRYQRRVFEKFFQVEDPLTRHHGGAGLGLFVARGIVEAHGSRIKISSQLGQGADFTFALPVYQPSAETAEV